MFSHTLFMKYHIIKTGKDKAGMELTLVWRKAWYDTNFLSHPRNLPQSVTCLFKVARRGKNGMINSSHLFGGACEDRASSSALNSAVRAQDLNRVSCVCVCVCVCVWERERKRERETCTATEESMSSARARSRSKRLPSLFCCPWATPSFSWRCLAAAASNIQNHLNTF